MCKFTVWACTKCLKIERPRRIASKKELPKRRYYALIEEERCGYWYCNAGDSAFVPAVSADTADRATCGDQMCVLDKCECQITTWDCCTARRYRRGRSQFYPFVYSIVVNASRDELRDADRLRIEPYYLPTLSAKTVLGHLMDTLPDDDYAVWYATYKEHNLGRYMNNYTFYISTFYKDDDDDDDRLRYLVKVVRRYGDVCPQLYEGVLSKFLKLRSLLREERRLDRQRQSGQLAFESYSLVIERRQSKRDQKKHAEIDRRDRI